MKILAFSLSFLMLVKMIELVSEARTTYTHQNEELLIIIGNVSHELGKESGGYKYLN